MRELSKNLEEASSYSPRVKLLRRFTLGLHEETALPFLD